MFYENKLELMKIDKNIVFYFQLSKLMNQNNSCDNPLKLHIRSQRTLFVGG